MNRQCFTASPEYAIELLRYIPERPDYNTWVQVISAIGNTFNESTAYNILKTRFNEEKPQETLYKIKRRIKGVNFGTLVFLAKKNGYSSNRTFTNRLYGDFKTRPYIKHVPKKHVTLNGDPELLCKFYDYEFEERSAIMEYDGKLLRSQAEKKIIDSFPNAKRERCFRIAINDRILNKNLNPITKNPYSDYKEYTNEFKNQYLTLNGIADYIGKGFSICCSHLKETGDGKTTKKNENFLFSELFGIDIEGGLSIENCFKMNETRKALLLYTTVNHTEHKHRYRLLFHLPRLIKNPEIYCRIVEKFIDIYNADKQCKEPARAFFGNNNTTIYLIQTGEILNFREGELI